MRRAVGSLESPAQCRRSRASIGWKFQNRSGRQQDLEADLGANKAREHVVGGAAAARYLENGGASLIASDSTHVNRYHHCRRALRSEHPDPENLASTPWPLHKARRRLQALRKRQGTYLEIRRWTPEWSRTCCRPPALAPEARRPARRLRTILQSRCSGRDDSARRAGQSKW